MIRPGDGIPPQLREEILKVANTVARRRRALGITQIQLDYEAGFSLRTTDTIERNIVDRRCFMPDDPRVLQILATLVRLEKDPNRPRYSRRPHPTTLRTKPKKSTEHESQTLKATIKRCPEMDVWITQGGCDGIRKTHAVCRARRFGLGCKGVSHRYRLERKEIEVRYTPPKPASNPETKLRREDWT